MPRMAVEAVVTVRTMRALEVSRCWSSVLSKLYAVRAAFYWNCVLLRLVIAVSYLSISWTYVTPLRYS